MKRVLRYLAYTALAMTLLLTLGAYAVYRSLLPADLPARPTTTCRPSSEVQSRWRSGATTLRQWHGFTSAAFRIEAMSRVSTT